MGKIRRQKRSKRAVAMLIAMIILVSTLGSLPTAVSAGTLSWTYEDLPDEFVDMAGDDIVDMDVSGDGSVIYVTTEDSTNWRIKRSTNGGESWTDITVIDGITTIAAEHIAVAPDDPNYIAVASDNAIVFISDDAGANWDSLGQIDSGASIDDVLDLDISVEKGGNHFVAVVGTDGGVGGTAEVWTYEIGAIGADWQDQSAEATFDTGELALAVAFSPNFYSDQVMVAVTGGPTADEAIFQVYSFNTDTWNSGAFTAYPVDLVQASETFSTFDAASIAMAPDYLGSDDSMRVAFVGLTVDAGSTMETSGIFRLDDDDVTVLRNEKEIHSVAFDGTNLVAGRHDFRNIYRCADPMWTPPSPGVKGSTKRPGGENKVVVAWAGSDVVAGTSGDESAFAVSTDNGTTFNDISLTAAGTDVSDFAVASDNTTIYAADTEADKIYRSTDAGVSWTELTNPGGASEPQLITVAPDDENYIAIVADDNEVYISDDGGTNWDSLGAVGIGNIRDLALSMEKDGNHFVAIAGEDGGVAEVWYYEIGAVGAAWNEISADFGFSAGDVAAAVAFSLNFAIDQVMVAVTSNYAGNTVEFQVYSYNTATWNSGAFAAYPVNLVQVSETISSLDSASIAMAPDYLGSDDTMRTCFVGLAVNGFIDTETDGIFRLDDDDVTVLRNEKAIHSVAFDGTNLVAGRYDTTTVYRCADPMWVPPSPGVNGSTKRPGGENKVVVAWAGSDVVAGTSGDESAFAVSTDNGATFNDISLTAAGTDVSDFAVASDNITVYAADTEADKVYRSTDAGASWTELINPAGATEPQHVAVVPDDANYIAIVADDNEVYISDDGGANWDSLGAVGIGNIRDLALSMEKDGNRFVAVAGEGGGVAEVWFYEIGWVGAAWIKASANLGFYTGDVAAAVAFSPNFNLDQVLVAITGDYINDHINFQIYSYNTATWNSGALANFPVDLVQSSETINSLDSASIAMAPDYLGSDDTMRTCFVGLAVNDFWDTETDGIFRLDDDDVMVLRNEKAIHSVAFDGTNLVAGRYDTTTVYRCADPMWTPPSPDVKASTSTKSPGGENKVMVAWAGSDVVAGTSGDESAFAVSTDNGATFNDISLIDTALTVLSDVAITPDGSGIYLVTADASNDLSLWRRASSWERIYSQQDADNDYIIRMAPDDPDVLYLADVGDTTICFSSDGGMGKWYHRVYRETIGVVDMAVETDGDTVYVLTSGGYVSKSTNRGFTWGSKHWSNLTGGGSMTMSLGKDLLLVGSQDGGVSYSTDGNTTWTKISNDGWVGGANDVQVTATGLSDGDFVLAACADGVNAWELGEDDEWDDITPNSINSTMVASGIALVQGVLYVLAYDTGGAGFDSVLARTLTPTSDDPTWSSVTKWGVQFDTWPQALSGSVDGDVTKLWAIDSVGPALYSYIDILSDIAVTPLSVDFGSVMVGSSSPPEIVTLTNNGSDDLIVYTITIGGPDAAEFEIQNDNCSGQTLAPGASDTVGVVFSPTTASGKSATLYIPSNDPDEATVNVTLSGNGTPAPVPHAVNLTASPVNITANGTSTSTLTVTVNDQFGDPVPDDTNVVFNTDHGTLGSSSIIKHTSGGVATATLTSESSTETVIATLTATANGASDTTAVFFIPEGEPGVEQSETETVTDNGTLADTPTGGDVSIDATGGHTITTAKYEDNPGGTPTFEASGNYYDVHLDNDTNVNSLTIEFSPATEDTTIFYWDGASWLPASDQYYDSITECIVVTITASTFPSLSDLTGLVFGSGLAIINVEIDVKPGSDPNSINLKSKGVVPVAVLSTGDFDASTIDPATVRFADAQVVRWTLEDINSDGDLDMLFHFKTQDLNLTQGSTEAILIGETNAGQSIEGTDTVKIVPKSK